jgi:hypothetical protein
LKESVYFVKETAEKDIPINELVALQKDETT